MLGYYTHRLSAGAVLCIFMARMLSEALVGACVAADLLWRALLVSCWPVLGEVTIWVFSGGEGSVGVAWVESM